ASVQGGRTDGPFVTAENIANATQKVTETHSSSCNCAPAPPRTGACGRSWGRREAPAPARHAWLAALLGFDPRHHIEDVTQARRHLGMGIGHEGNIGSHLVLVARDDEQRLISRSRAAAGLRYVVPHQAGGYLKPLLGFLGLARHRFAPRYSLSDGLSYRPPLLSGPLKGTALLFGSTSLGRPGLDEKRYAGYQGRTGFRRA